ncbi:hypothetical protein [Polyangium aurulentum]|uniref:hypothetical protein n=1 Tax=Polyangium aurulentum TaxID=2567896 RepID=UPI0010ADBD29|nr:hypothetical protein [Polyangium aurulentum]UQA56070.1 hypothetical protein E8A73_032780 [Polyangium aurulentum]
MTIDRSSRAPAEVGSDTDLSVRPYAQASRDPRALRILAKTIYRELRQGGLGEEDVMAVAGELLSLVAGDMKDRRTACEPALGPSSRPAR